MPCQVFESKSSAAKNPRTIMAAAVKNGDEPYAGKSPSTSHEDVDAEGKESNGTVE